MHHITLLPQILKKHCLWKSLLWICPVCLFSTFFFFFFCSGGKLEASFFSTAKCCFIIPAYTSPPWYMATVELFLFENVLFPCLTDILFNTVVELLQSHPRFAGFWYRCVVCSDWLVSISCQCEKDPLCVHIPVLFVKGVRYDFWSL